MKFNIISSNNKKIIFLLIKKNLYCIKEILSNFNIELESILKDMVSEIPNLLFIKHKMNPKIILWE